MRIWVRVGVRVSYRVRAEFLLREYRETSGKRAYPTPYANLARALTVTLTHPNPNLNTKVKILFREKSETSGEKAIEMRTFGTSDLDVYHQPVAPEVIVKFVGYDVPLVYFRKVHAVSMVIAFAMLFGAGVMFTRRVQDLAECQDIFAYDEAFVVGAVVYEKDGALWLGQPDEL
jgi:hypothetical protein